MNSANMTSCPTRPRSWCANGPNRVRSISSAAAAARRPRISRRWRRRSRGSRRGISPMCRCGPGSQYSNPLRWRLDNMTDTLPWLVREAGENDTAALALIGTATFLETFAGILDGDAIISHCAAAHSESAYRAYFAAGARAWLAELQPGGPPVGFALVGVPDLAAAGEGAIELKRIYSLSRFHGSGLGAALMNCAVTAAAGYDRLLDRKSTRLNPIH